MYSMFSLQFTLETKFCAEQDRSLTDTQAERDKQSRKPKQCAESSLKPRTATVWWKCVHHYKKPLSHACSNLKSSLSLNYIHCGEERVMNLPHTKHCINISLSVDPVMASTLITAHNAQVELNARHVTQWNSIMPFAEHAYVGIFSSVSTNLPTLTQRREAQLGAAVIDCKPLWVYK